MKDSKQKKQKIYFALIWLLVIILPFISLTQGRYSVTLRQFLGTIFPSLSETEEISKAAYNVIFKIRIPRILLAMLAGAGLSVAGASFQSIFSNPLASPDTLGVATGASFGAVLGILLKMPYWAIQLTALAFGLVAVFLVFTVSSIRGKASIVMIVLAGMVISALFSALVSLVKFTADPQDVLPAVTFWLMGTLQGTSLTTLANGAPFIIAGIAVITVFRYKLNLLTLSEDEATSLGINVKRSHIVIILAASLITASVVSMCGLIGWVGLLIPHISRMLFGNNNKSVIPACIGLGAIFMLIIDTIARTAAGTEIPVSILTAVIGAPFFIILLRKTGGIKS